MRNHLPAHTASLRAAHVECDYPAASGAAKQSIFLLAAQRKTGLLRGLLGSFSRRFTFAARNDASLKRLVIALPAILLATPIHAAMWKIAPATSTLTFEGEHAGEKFKGSFPTFTSVIDFDERAPEKGKIDITIDMASAKVEGNDRQEAISGADWFAAKQFPTAVFSSTSITSQGSDKSGINHYTAKGTLSIRGIRKEIALPFLLQSSGKTTLARGEVTLNRQDFGIGQGEWKTDAYIKYPVKVSFVLNASQQ